MPTPTKYTRSLATDFGGSINTTNLVSEIHANSNITIDLDNNRIDTSGDDVDLWFKDPISAAEETELDSVVIPAHDSTPSPATATPVAIEGVEMTDGDKLHVHASPRPSNMSTYFSSAGDNSGLALGPLLGVKMGAGDTEKSVTVEYDELVYIKDGYITTEGAPFGAWLSCLILDASDVVVGSFVQKTLVLGDNRMPFDTEDKGVLPQGYKIKLVVHNADGTGDWDAAAAFKVVARVEMYRTTTA